MKYSVTNTREELERQCAEARVGLPFSEYTSVLATPVNILNRTVNNRMVYQAMEGCDGTLEGVPDELTIRRYMRFAEGGAGIIWFEATAVMENGRANPRQLYINEKNFDAFKNIVLDIKERCIKVNGYEPIVICQLTHSGRYSKPEGVPAPLIAYNNPIFEKDNPIDKSRILSDDQLDEICEALIKGAKLAERAGFDGADIKCCHRYLLCELLSAFTRENSRYGGSFENRTRLIRTAVEGALANRSRPFIITTRINAYDGFEYPYGFGVKDGEGIKPDFTEAKMLCRELVKLGMPLVNLTMGNPYVNPHVNRPFSYGPYEHPEPPIAGVARMLDGIAEVAAEIKGTPVISSGISYLGAMSPNVVAAYIRDGKFDFAGYGRETLAYPDLAKDICNYGTLNPKKVCIACGKCSEIMRKPGGTPGCVIRDGAVYAPLYKKLCAK
ncbi:MAG: flavin oxidoreductase/NADH oxidase [Clostridia bacterium]|nr:flavin oxidoreductase/NADH oxidase [Clostridia bacterium]